MKLRYKILNTLLTLVAVTVVGLAFALSHNSPCVTPAAPSSEQATMKAVMYFCYGSADVLELVDTVKPVPAANEVLVKIHAASVNPLDWHYMRGSPYIMRAMIGMGAPTNTTIGVDFAGTVEAVGAKVTQFIVGDRVFGGRGGAFAEYIVIPEDRAMVKIPANISFEQAASVPIAAVTALQALRDVGKVKAGQKVLINGASGGVGTFAVQIAKSLGAEVTGVCSARNADMVRSLGADHVLDYRQENYTQSNVIYDVIIDNVGNHSLLANLDVLQSEGILVMVGGGKGDWLAPFMSSIQALVFSPFVEQEVHSLMAQQGKDIMQELADLMRDGKMTPVIDRRYALSDIAEAIRYSEQGHAKGKIIVNVE
jgi:NADPH:quinone reductase-like Zn-dependent oxidoreductase